MNERRSGELLVFGDDGSWGADVAWLWVANHRWPGWRAEVVTATPPPLPAPLRNVAELEEWESRHPRLPVAESGLESIRHLSAPSDPRVLLGGRSDATLLVVGFRGLGHVRALLVGSTGEWLLHHPPAPMAMVRSATPVRRVVACVDGSEHAQRAVEAFARLPWADGTEVVVLGVWDGWAEPEAGQARALASLQAAGITAEARAARGKAAPAVLQTLEEVDAQLVVLGTRGLTGWNRLRLGSTAGTVVRAAHCSALVACVDDRPDDEPEGAGA